MTNSDAPTLVSADRIAGLRRAAPALLLLLALVVASLLPTDTGRLRLADPDRTHLDQLRLAIGGLPEGALVLIACDADLGTYPEIRAATRSPGTPSARSSRRPSRGGTSWRSGPGAYRTARSRRCSRAWRATAST